MQGKTMLISGLLLISSQFLYSSDRIPVITMPSHFPVDIVSLYVQPQAHEKRRIVDAALFLAERYIDIRYAEEGIVMPDLTPRLVLRCALKAAPYKFPIQCADDRMSRDATEYLDHLVVRALRKHARP